MSFRQTGIDIDKILLLANETLKSAVKYIQEQTNSCLVILPITEPNFTSTNYAMKTISPIAGLEKDSKAVMVFFEPGDGTGSRINYTIDGLVEKYIPRDKKGYAEVFLPIGTVFENYFIPYLTSLDEVTLNTKKTGIVSIEPLGIKGPDYFNALTFINPAKTSAYPVSSIQLTYYSVNGYGNPHAVRFNDFAIRDSQKPFIQIGAFIALEKENEKTKKIVNLTQEPIFRGRPYSSIITLQ
ncbi:MAG: hypothetical protein WC916_04155 [Candidatus Woesearchaeota archaeon]